MDTTSESSQVQNQQLLPAKLRSEKKTRFFSVVQTWAKDVQILSPKMFVAILAFFHGLNDLQSLATTLYAKQTLGLKPHEITFYYGLATVHFSLKPICGYFLDRVMRVIQNAKLIILFTSIAKLINFSLLASRSLTPFTFYLLIFFNSFAYVIENIIGEYLMVLETKRLNRQNGEKNNQLPVYFGSRAFGSLIGAFFGGRFIANGANTNAYLICSYFPIVLVGILFFYKEPPYVLSERKSFKEELQSMKDLLSRDKVMTMMIFVILINMQPNFDQLTMFYFTEKLNFSTEMLANFQAFGTMCYIIGLVSYSMFFRHVSPQKFFLITNFMLWGINLTFLMVVLQINARFGINNTFFCLFSTGFYYLVAEMNFMPILTVWCALCPDSLEATSITLFTGLINLSNNFSSYIGSFIMKMINFTANDYSLMWLSVIIQNFYLLLVIIGLFFIEFPNSELSKRNLKSTKKNSEQDISLSSSNKNDTKPLEVQVD